MCWITFFCTHRFNLAYGFVTFARFARLFFLNDSSRKLLLISDAKINNGSWSSDCFFLTLVLDYILIHPQMQSRLRLRYLCSLRSPVFLMTLLECFYCYRMLVFITEACLLIVFFLTLVSDYILIHPQIQSRLRLRYLCSLRSPVFFNDSSRKLLLISGACINNGSLSSDCFFLTLVLDYVLIHPQIQSRLRLRYLCSLRSPVFF